jgi:hypothetical protein
MARASLAALLLLFGGTSLVPADSGSCPPAQELSIVADLLAPFSAEAGKVEGDTLILLDLRDVRKGTRGQQLAGRVLLDGDKDVLWPLWVLAVGGNMARATPLLGREGPGAGFPRSLDKLGGVIPVSDPPVLFRTPVRLTLIPLDSRGAPCSPRQVTVRKIRQVGVRL